MASSGRPRPVTTAARVAAASSVPLRPAHDVEGPAPTIFPPRNVWPARSDALSSTPHLRVMSPRNPLSAFPLAFLLVLSFLPARAATNTADRLADFFQAGKIRALILSGRCNHDWRTTTPHLRQLLVDSGRFDVRVEEAVDGINAETLAPFDVLIMDYGGPRWPATTEKAVEDFVRAGKGLVLAHGAVYHFSGLSVLTDRHRSVDIRETPWTAFREMVGCGWDTPPPKGFHGARHTFPLTFTKRDHPITAGLPESLTATDELYQGMRVLPHAEVLARSHAPMSRGGTDQDEPMLIVNRFGEGRVFTTVLGHELAGMWEEAFRIPFVRGTEWAASGKVTLAPEACGPRHTTHPIRTLVVTGGHDYPTSFYTVLEGHPDIVWEHARSNADAFRGDLRNRFDVLVLYDMSANLDDVGRGHLREFIEAHKGLVVLHHAMADYQGWEWWWREVVGGRYVTKEEPGFKASDFRHDEWVAIEPAGPHPITSEIGPLRLFDETYRGVWTAPGIRPLLKTSNPTSDEVIGWISPCALSRVAVIQPGHGTESHRHPAYRKLVQNAVEWAAGRRQ